MNERTTEVAVSAIPTWEELEGWVRVQIQEFIQELLKQEVTELLGRARYQRRVPVDGAQGYRNGYGKPRKLTLGMGTITIRRPRVRGLEEPFESRTLPLFARRTREVSDLLPKLYLHGLAEGDFDLALRGLLG
jgi:transposase-like protein